MVQLKPNPDSPCIFTKGLAVHGVLPMPVRHGEGKLVARDAATLQRLQACSQGWSQMRQISWANGKS